MTGPAGRGLDVLGVLVGQVEGLTLTSIAERAGLAKSATHRILADLTEVGYVRRDGEQGEFVLTLKFVSLGLRHLAANSLVELSRPALAGLAAQSEALVRLSLVDGPSLVWVASFQGARHGLKYDPDSGGTASLEASASGLAWMAQLSDDDAMRLIFRQRENGGEALGPNAPRSIDEIRAYLVETRAAGYATTDETYAVGLAAIAAPVFSSDHGRVVGVVSIAGPNVILTAERRRALAPSLIDVSAQLSTLDLPTRTELVSARS